jgi:cell fate (sporulation/competence/biofilm development) regulator YmcA (YheA/YmcA/DUF963 family)
MEHWSYLIDHTISEIQKDISKLPQTTKGERKTHDVSETEQIKYQTEKRRFKITLCIFKKHKHTPEKDSMTWCSYAVEFVNQNMQITSRKWRKNYKWSENLKEPVLLEDIVKEKAITEIKARIESIQNCIMWDSINSANHNNTIATAWNVALSLQSKINK